MNKVSSLLIIPTTRHYKTRPLPMPITSYNNSCISGHTNESAYSLALRELTRNWSEDIGDDKTASLISRVALNAVYIEPESPEVIEKACPVV